MQSRQQRHSKPEITQWPGTKQLFGSASTSSQEQNNPAGAQDSIAVQPFGSAAAAAPAFGGPPIQPAQAAGSAQIAHRDPSSAENASLARSEDKDVRLHPSSAVSVDAQPSPGPFGRTTGLSLDMACGEPDCPDGMIEIQPRAVDAPEEPDLFDLVGLQSMMTLQSASVISLSLIALITVPCITDVWTISARTL